MPEDTVTTRSEVVDDLATWKAIAFVGAGTSRELGLPLAAQIDALLTHLAGATVGPSNRREASATIASDPEKTKRFKEEMHRVCLEVAGTPSDAIDRLCYLFHIGRIRHIVTTNWDDVIEQHYEALIGRPIRMIVRPDQMATLPADALADEGRALWKIHGDVNDPEFPWIMLHEDGRVFDGLLQRLSGTPDILLIMGYSGSDAVVMRALLGPLSQTRKAYVASTQPLDDSTGLRAKRVPERSKNLLEAIGTISQPPWSAEGLALARFRGGGTLGEVLDGLRLTDRLVATVAPLPSQVDALRSLLDERGMAHIRGEHGAGKSSLAYQTAAKMHAAGADVLEWMTDHPWTDTSMSTARAAVDAYPRPLLMIIDDAHRLSVEERQFIDRWRREAASARHRFLLISTEEEGESADGPLFRDVAESRVDWPQTREAMKSFFLGRDVPLQVANYRGIPFSDQTYARWVQEAFAPSISGPWQAVYVLAGGERRTHQHLQAMGDAGGRAAQMFVFSMSVLYVTGNEMSLSCEQVNETIPRADLRLSIGDLARVMTRGGRVCIDVVGHRLRPNHWRQALAVFSEMIGTPSELQTECLSVWNQVLTNLTPDQLEGCRRLLLAHRRAHLDSFGRALRAHRNRFAMAISNAKGDTLGSGGELLVDLQGSDGTDSDYIFGRIDFDRVRPAIAASTGDAIHGIARFFSCVATLDSSALVRRIRADSSRRNVGPISPKTELVFRELGAGMGQLLNQSSSDSHWSWGFFLQELSSASPAQGTFWDAVDPQAVGHQFENCNRADVMGSAFFLQKLRHSNRALATATARNIRPEPVTELLNMTAPGEPGSAFLWIQELRHLRRSLAAEIERLLSEPAHTAIARHRARP